MSKILYHVIGKKHERIGFMSHTHCILTLLDLKDTTITFPEDWMKEVHIKGIRSKVVSGILSFQPTHCYQCGHVFDSGIIY